jgi:glycosyltransferase involved in cell wall biosynthesis
MLAMKVIQIIARMNQGGTSRWIENLVIGLRKNGHTVILLSGNVESNEIEDPIFIGLGGIRVEGLGRSVSLMGDLKSIFKIRSVIKSEKPDLINTHTAKAGSIGRIAAIGLKTKVVHTFHGHLLYGYFSPFKTKLIIVIEKFLALISDSLIAVGQKTKIELVGVGVAKSEKMFSIAPAVKKEPNSSARSLRQNLEIEDSEFVVGWLGRLTQIKRPDRVIELANALPTISFLIGGEGELQQTLERNLPPNVRLIGWVKPFDFWPNCDAALLTSDNEGMPTALIEAALCGIPIVAENVGSVSEIVHPGVNGYLVSNFEERLSALVELQEDSLKRQKLGAGSLESSEENFSVEKFISEHESIYNSVVRNH